MMDSDDNYHVAIGFESGGIDGVFECFDKMPIDSNLVFIIIQDLFYSNEGLNYIDFANKNNEDKKIFCSLLIKVIDIIKDYCDIDFSNYKEIILFRRLNKRIKMNGSINLTEYVSYLKKSDNEKEMLKKDLLIHVTEFFRDKEAFNELQLKVIPNLHYSKGCIRLWSAGCSTGEEAYSILILLEEYMNRNNIQADVKLFATDIDEDAILTASKGFYNTSALHNVDNKLLEKYFIKRKNGFQVSKNIRNKVLFTKGDITKGTFFSNIDLIICRNLLIYFKNDLQKELLLKFSKVMTNKSYLFLGGSESVVENNYGFECIDYKWKFYRNNYKK